jgi:hypothetical protein
VNWSDMKKPENTSTPNIAQTGQAGLNSPQVA